MMSASPRLEDRVNEYCEPIYRYCLKRLINIEDAEDLAQDILFDVIRGLSRGGVRNIDAWIWTLASNHYRC